MVPNAFVDGELARLHAAGFNPPALRAFAAAFRRRARETATASPGLRREAGGLRWVGLLLSALLTLGVAASGGPLVASLLAGWAAWLILTGWVWAELGLLRHPLSDEPAGAIGVANYMTLFRGWAAVPVLTLGLTTAGPTPLWFGLCLAAGLTDLVDGSVAIRLGQETRLGRLLDPFMDTLFFTAAAVSLARWGLLPWWLAALVGVRYALPLLGGLSLMLARGRTIPVRHTPWGQRSTMAIGLALSVTWLSAQVRLPAALTLACDLLAVAVMVLALAGIARRAGA